MHPTDEEVRDRFAVPVNGTEVPFRDSVITGRQMLVAAGLTPPSEHQLILVHASRTRLVGIDDEINLQEIAGGAFRVFRSDRAYAFTTDEIGQIWGEATMQVDELLAILGVDNDRDLVLERDDEPDLVLRSGGTLSFEPAGVEDIVSRPHHGPEFVMVTVFTTSGTFPAEGALKVKASTPIADVLARAARKLTLGDTSTWVASVDGRDLDPSKSFAESGLAGEIEIEWNPREGGGGHA